MKTFDEFLTESKYTNNDKSLPQKTWFIDDEVEDHEADELAHAAHGAGFKFNPGNLTMTGNYELGLKFLADYFGY